LTDMDRNARVGNESTSEVQLTQSTTMRKTVLETSHTEVSCAGQRTDHFSVTSTEGKARKSWMRRTSRCAITASGGWFNGFNSTNPIPHRHAGTTGRCKLCRELRGRVCCACTHHASPAKLLSTTLLPRLTGSFWGSGSGDRSGSRKCVSSAACCESHATQHATERRKTGLPHASLPITFANLHYL
jgi:hypothetical protein